MIKVIIFAVIGLVLGLGGGSGMAVMRAKKVAAAAHDSTLAAKADSTEKDEHGADEAKPKSHETPSAEHPVPAASAPTDSATQLAHAPAPVKQDSAAVTPAPVPHAAAPAPNKPAPRKPAPVVAATSHGPAVPSPTTVAKAADGATQPAAPGRISKIFGAMTAKDAARVLQQMDDTDVQTVLSGLSDKQAAAILSGFPAERAAAISRATLRRTKGAS